MKKTTLKIEKDICRIETYIIYLGESHSMVNTCILKMLIRRYR